MPRVRLYLSRPKYWPKRCPCCLTPTDNTAPLAVLDSHWLIPYCGRCLDHVRLSEDLEAAEADLLHWSHRRGQSLAMIAGGVAGLFLSPLALLLPEVEPFLVAAGATFLLLVVGAGNAWSSFSLHAQARRKADRLTMRLRDRTGDTCTCPGPAVALDRAIGDEVRLNVESHDYASRLRELNP